MVELGVNIDHVATLRQARKTYEPDPVWAAAEAELGGADGITIHLREDRRHIGDRDLAVLRQTVHVKLNLEMSLVPEIVDIAVRSAPTQATLVPERRAEITTEGGIDLSQNPGRIIDAVGRLKAAGTFVCAFIDPDEKQIALAAEQGFDGIELHTGTYANAPPGSGAATEALARLETAAYRVGLNGMRLHAGHGLNYRNLAPVVRIPSMRELNIGHAIISRAIFTGLQTAVADMKRAIAAALNNAEVS
jgi:pyridoxine 5-phosphate synthase